jgi:hypothetical protein
MADLQAGQDPHQHPPLEFVILYRKKPQIGEGQRAPSQ